MFAAKLEGLAPMKKGEHRFPRGKRRAFRHVCKAISTTNGHAQRFQKTLWRTELWYFMYKKRAFLLVFKNMFGEKI